MIEPQHLGCRLLVHTPSSNEIWEGVVAEASPSGQFYRLEDPDGHSHWIFARALEVLEVLPPRGGRP